MTKSMCFVALRRSKHILKWIAAIANIAAETIKMPFVTRFIGSRLWSERRSYISLGLRGQALSTGEAKSAKHNIWSWVLIQLLH